MSRPYLDLPWTGLEKVLEVIALAGWLGTLVLVGLNWHTLPEQIPRHYNLVGEVDAYGGKSTVLLLPVVSSVLWASLTLLSRYPHIYNYLVEITEQNAARQYRLARRLIISLKAIVAVLFLGITWHVIDSAHGVTYSILPIVTIPIGLIMIITVMHVVSSLRAR